MPIEPSYQQTPQGPLNPSAVDLSTFVDVLRSEDNAQFEKMFMTQDDPIGQILPKSVDAENSEEVFQLFESMVADKFTPLQFHMLQRLFAGTEFQKSKKHGHQEGHYRNQHFETYGEMPPHHAGLNDYKKGYQSTFDRLNRAEEEQIADMRAYGAPQSGPYQYNPVSSNPKFFKINHELEHLQTRYKEALGVVKSHFANLPKKERTAATKPYFKQIGQEIGDALAQIVKRSAGTTDIKKINQRYDIRSFQRFAGLAKSGYKDNPFVASGFSEGLGTNKAVPRWLQLSRSQQSLNEFPDALTRLHIKRGWVSKKKPAPAKPKEVAAGPLRLRGGSGEEERGREVSRSPELSPPSEREVSMSPEPPQVIRGPSPEPEKRAASPEEDVKPKRPQPTDAQKEAKRNFEIDKNMLANAKKNAWAPIFKVLKTPTPSNILRNYTDAVGGTPTIDFDFLQQDINHLKNAIALDTTNFLEGKYGPNLKRLLDNMPKPKPPKPPEPEEKVADESSESSDPTESD